MLVTLVKILVKYDFLKKISWFCKNVAIDEYLLEHIHKTTDFLENAKICFNPVISNAQLYMATCAYLFTNPTNNDNK